MADQRVTTAEAAKLLGVTPKTIARLAESGKLTKHKALVGSGRGGLRVWFDRAEVESLQSDRIVREPAGAVKPKRKK